MMNRRSVLPGALLLCLARPSRAEEPGALQRTGQAIDRGAQRTGDAVGRGARRTGEAVDRGARRTGSALERGVQRTGSALERAGNWTAERARRLHGRIAGTN
mgnify:CR=1 FL=1